MVAGLLLHPHHLLLALLSVPLLLVQLLLRLKRHSRVPVLRLLGNINMAATNRIGYSRLVPPPWPGLGSKHVRTRHIFRPKPHFHTFRKGQCGASCRLGHFECHEAMVAREKGGDGSFFFSGRKKKKDKMLCWVLRNLGKYTCTAQPRHGNKQTYVFIGS